MTLKNPLVPRMPLEKDIMREICEWLETRKDLMFWRSNNVPVFGMGGRNNDRAPRFRALPKYTPRGLPDICIIKDGKFIALEVKREGAKLRPEQAEFGVKLCLHNASYFVAHSLYEVQNLFLPL